MKKILLRAGIPVFLFAGGMFFPTQTSESQERPDCPGKIDCPVTGKEICKDRCPLPAKSGEESHLPACCRRS